MEKDPAGPDHRIIQLWTCTILQGMGRRTPKVLQRLSGLPTSLECGGVGRAPVSPLVSKDESNAQWSHGAGSATGTLGEYKSHPNREHHELLRLDQFLPLNYNLQSPSSCVYPNNPFPMEVFNMDIEAVLLWFAAIIGILVWVTWL